MLSVEHYNQAAESRTCGASWQYPTNRTLSSKDYSGNVLSVDSEDHDQLNLHAEPLQSAA